MNPEIELQPASADIWSTKYQLRTKDGEAVDKSVEDTFRRVAKALAFVEPIAERLKWEDEFYKAMLDGATPAGRIISNAGAEEHKPNASTINCTVSSTIHDSMHGILQGLYEAGITLAAGCGIGYDFSTLRPRGAFVAGVGAKTSGAISFMNIYDAMCFTVASAGGRRGAQMGTMDIRHPDIEAFITAKRENGQLRQFNLSVLITDDFMRAVENDDPWDLIFPMNPKESELNVETVWEFWPNVEPNYIVNSEGAVKCRIYKTVRARALWDLIMHSNYNFAEPGFILIDNYNRMNNNWFCENIRATNPCGEQGLPPYGACLLGSINLTKFVTHPFSTFASFDWEKFKKTVRIFTRMLDNVVELNGLPLLEQQEEIKRKRRHGMGYYGLGSAMTMMGMTYGDDASLEFTETVTRLLAIVGLDEGVKLAEEKGMAPVLQEKFVFTGAMLARNPEVEAVFTVGCVYTGLELFMHSGYMKQIRAFDPDLYWRIGQHGIRFTHHSSIAPTGTLSLSFGNNVSNGIEPTFAHEYRRNVIREGRKTKEAMTVKSYELLVWEQMNAGGVLAFNGPTTDSIKPRDHMRIQAVAQRWIDSSISKTVNVPTDISFEDFKDVYKQGYRLGCKGVATFRFNPEAFQGVLVKETDLENTFYRFTLDDGSKITVKGNQQVRYDGHFHSAANLYDAIKEGTYGKY
jgi:ribonucleoside-diphosphate reductase alpha chain